MEILVGSDDDADGAVTGALSEDRVFSLLAAGRRREVLRCLQREGGDLPLSALTRAVGLGEGVGPDADAAEFKRVYVSLYQTHVPVLQDAGVLEYDPESKVVRLTPRAESLYPYLDLADPAGGSGAAGFFSRFFQHAPSG